MTNYEKIKAMSVEEFAKFARVCVRCRNCPAGEMCDETDNVSCEEMMKKWLLQEAEE